MKIYNTLSGKKENFQPLTLGQVSLYVCGMTVYDFCHIGHARIVVVFDVLTRYLKDLGYSVKYVRNITDIDDKIIKKAKENNEPFRALTERMTTAMHEDMQKLGILRPMFEPKASEYISSMIHLIQRLLEKKVAYQSEDGDVWFSIKQFKNYGELALQDLQKLRQGNRISSLVEKNDLLDFVLWKHAKPDEKPSWPSPWGLGRPGWHIECSAMSMECLGEQLDIHGGGADLRFPHHQNEIAQSEAVTGKQFVNYWMHVGFVQVKDEKMSKSLNNFFTLRDVFKDYTPEVVRYFLIASHYRSPVNYSDENLNSAKSALLRFYTALRALPLETAKIPENLIFKQQFLDALADDLNTPAALAVMFELTREINRLRLENLSSAAQYGKLLIQLGEFLGILQQSPEFFLKHENPFFDSSKIENFIALRNEARKNKNWMEADRIRNILLAQGIILEDSGNVTSWRHI